MPSVRLVLQLTFVQWCLIFVRLQPPLHVNILKPKVLMWLLYFYNPVHPSYNLWYFIRNNNTSYVCCC